MTSPKYLSFMENSQNWMTRQCSSSQTRITYIQMLKEKSNSWLFSVMVWVFFKKNVRKQNQQPNIKIIVHLAWWMIFLWRKEISLSARLTLFYRSICLSGPPEELKPRSTSKCCSKSNLSKHEWGEVWKLKRSLIPCEGRRMGTLCGHLFIHLFIKFLFISLCIHLF